MKDIINKNHACELELAREEILPAFDAARKQIERFVIPFPKNLPRFVGMKFGSLNETFEFLPRE